MRMVLVLTVICIISAFLLGLTYSMTIDKIRFQEGLAEKNALSAVIPGAVSFSKEASGYYKGFNSEGGLAGYAVLGEGKGYSSVIRIMTGIDTEGNITGVKILSQRETPGLGARIEEPWFQKQFSEKGVDKVDTITGATISSRTAVEIVRKALDEEGIS